MKDIINIVCDEGATSRVVIGSVEENFESLLPGGTPRIIIVTDAKVHANTNISSSVRAKAARLSSSSKRSTASSSTWGPTGAPSSSVWAAAS